MTDHLARECDSLTPEPMAAWFVWTKRGNRPRFAHADEALAVKEAARLALQHPGEAFIVMHATHKFRAPVS